MNHFIVTAIFSFLTNCASCYKPVIIIHGIFDHRQSLFPMRDRIMEAHPGTNATVINILHGVSSLNALWFQVGRFQKAIQPIMQNSPEGVNIIGFSQGGLIARALIQSMPDHNVDTFISLSSPQGGQFGDQFLKILFPTIVKEHAWKLFYRDSGQHISVGNYWRDPHHLEAFYNSSEFLPVIDNEVISEESETFKKGFMSLKKLVLIGGPDDGVISPWQSSQFGCYNENEQVLTMEDRSIYQYDTFGLKTLNENGKIFKHTIPGVKHLQWHKLNKITDNYIIPYLD